MKLDLFDYKIIAEIEREPRASLSKIGKKISRSQQFVNYRLSQFVKEKIVSLSTSINLFKLGYRNFFLFIKLADVEDVQKTFQAFVNSNNINWVIQTGFEYDFIIMISSKSIPKLYEKINGIIREMSLSKLMLKEIVIQYQLAHAYVTRNKKTVKNSAFTLPNKIDELDYNILKEINTDCRKSALSIGNKFKVNYKTVINRVRSMQERGIISGYRAYINPEALGYNSYFIHFETGAQKHTPMEVLKYLQKIKGCTDVFELLGTYSYALILRVKNNLEVNGALSSLKRQFSQIETINVLPVFDDSLFNNFPIHKEH
jgi:Lrp/AsnC family leucine-responsive transcriptional regulator